MALDETGGVDPGSNDVGAVQEAERASPGNTTGDGRTDTDRATDGAAVQEALGSDPGQAVLGAVAEQVGGEGDAEAAPAQAAAPTADAAPPDPDAPFAPTPPPDTFMQRMREQVASGVGRTVGEAQAIGGWAGDMIGGAAAAVEAGYEAAVSGIEAATDWIGDEYAQAQRDDLAARVEGLRAAAEEVIDDPAGVARAFAEGFEARYAQADALEGAYRSGHADLSAYREAERIRGEADTELAILGVETAAVALGGAGAIAKGLRAARIADRLDDATPLAMAMAQTQRARAGAEAVDLLTEQPGRRAQFDAEEIADVTDARLHDPNATDAIVGTGLWQRTEAAGRRVYQRDDLIDPERVDGRGLTNLERMERGQAPIGPDGEPLNLHHMTQDEPGPMAEVTTTLHQENFRTLHLYTNQHDKTYRGDDGNRHPYQSAPPSVDRGAFDDWRKEYWAGRAEDFQ